MNDKDFKMKMIEDMAVVKTDVKHIKLNMPHCEKKTIYEKIKTNRRLIYFIMGTYTLIIAAMVAVRSL